MVNNSTNINKMNTHLKQLLYTIVVVCISNRIIDFTITMHFNFSPVTTKETKSQYVSIRGRCWCSCTYTSCQYQQNEHSPQTIIVHKKMLEIQVLAWDRFYFNEKTRSNINIQDTWTCEHNFLLLVFSDLNLFTSRPK
jgi:hypothetical protein